MPNPRRICLALLALVLVCGEPSWGQDEAPDPSAEAEAPAGAPAGAEAGEDEAAGPPAPAGPAPPPIYEDQLLRLSEILGALAFLRQLCGEKDAAGWRDEMSALLAAEHPAPDRRGRLVGRFNHGFETYNAVYRSCTPSARLAISRYLDEGKTVSNEVRSRYGQ